MVHITESIMRQVLQFCHSFNGLSGIHTPTPSALGEFHMVAYFGREERSLRASTPFHDIPACRASLHTKIRITRSLPIDDNRASSSVSSSVPTGLPGFQRLVYESVDHFRPPATANVCPADRNIFGMLITLVTPLSLQSPSPQTGCVSPRILCCSNRDSHSNLLATQKDG